MTRCGWGGHTDEKFHNNPPYPVAMAKYSRRKPKMYKDLSFVSVKNLGSSGAPIAIMRVQKQQGQMTSAFIKNLRIHCILNDVSGASTPSSDMPVNFMFYATTTGSSVPTSGNCIAAAATGYGGGSVNLTLNRVIRDNDYDPNSGDHAIAIWAECTDATVTADIELKLVAESYGRWHEVVSA